jgi:hypothetical protein
MAMSRQNVSKTEFEERRFSKRKFACEIRDGEIDLIE